uniref:chromophore lyase cpcS/cpeS n=1 Tax=Chroothece richteriana TaxID=101928 RepID=UPI001FCCD715|nr:chromophore lyase cpcS/cpeS [Chroothece richteriana]UNJ14299.1 chromophore lyase cpcS/cpeS [Chroothece richteriana]
MNIEHFLSNLNGKWLVQQTLYHLISGKMQSEKSEVIYKTTDKFSSLPFKQLSHIYGVDIYWNNAESQLKHSLYFFYTPLKKDGYVIKWTSNNSKLMTGNFFLHETGVLHLLIHQSIHHFSINEKIFTPTSKLKLNNSIVKKYGICLFVSFISEIKLTTEMSPEY